MSAVARFTCGLMSTLVICKQRKEYGIKHDSDDTECRYQVSDDQVSLFNTNLKLKL